MDKVYFEDKLSEIKKEYSDVANLMPDNLTNKEWNALVSLVQNKEIDESIAKELCFYTHLKLAAKFAHGCDNDEFQEYCIALHNACKCYSFNRNAKFITYAYACLVDATRRMWRGCIQKNTFARNYIPNLTATPNQMVKLRYNQDLNENLLKEEVVARMKYLPPREKHIIQLRFYKDMNLKDIGGIYNISKERVRQLINRSLVSMMLKQNVKSRRRKANQVAF